jgi:hypothetical protein
MRSIVPLFVAGLATICPGLRAQDPEVQKQLKELRERIDELEEQQLKTGERLGSRSLVQAYTAKSLDLGGHLTSVFTYIDGESDSEAGHMVSLVELFLKAELDDQWSLFATPGFYTFNGALLDNPATPTAPGDPLFTRDSIAESNVFLSRVYGQWKHSDRLIVQGGIVGSPHGTTNREYFIPSRTIGVGSLHTRYFLTNQLYPQLVEGLRASGKYSFEQDWIEYDAYFGVEDNSADDPIGGARAGYVFADLGLTVAANYGRGTRESLPTAPVNLIASNFGALQSPFRSQFNFGRDYQFGGIDVDLRIGEIVGKTEAYYSAEDGFEDQRAFSSEWTWFAATQWSFGYRFDYYDPGEDFDVFALAVVPTGHSTEHVLSVNFNPNQSVRLRLDFHHNNLPGSDDTADFVNFSWSISF